ncbi:MAG: hypothetical protein KC636_02590, partial [Myxococcales bacterium]|nr:hypothetical protein [Myxococcales bacterium]
MAIAPLFGAIACGDDVEETGLSTGGGATGSTAGPTGGSETTHDAGTDATDATDTGVSDSDSTTDVGPCAACPANYLCWDDVCIPDLGPCETNDDCPGDSYCDDGTCVPYGVPEAVVNDPMCQKEALPDGVQPAVQCEWEGTEPGDPTAEYTNIYTTPIVADLKLGAGTTAKPSIIVTTWRSEGPFDRYGMLRVFDGATCEEQLRAGGEDLPEEEMLADRPSYGSQWAVGDLDGDIPDGGHPEIVGLQRPDAADIKAHVRLYAFRIDSSGPDPKLERAWYGRDCDDDTIIEFANGHANHGPSLIDLDDDGLPEVIFDEMVFSNEGCLLSAYSDFLYGTIGLGMMTAVLDVDLDERPDLVRHNRVAAWNEVTTEWENKEYFLDDETVQTPGHIGVANAGLYSDVGGVDPELLPEVVIVAGDPNGDQNENSGYIRMQDLAGSIVWGPISLYHKPGQFGGRGGPPTISDFDG